MICALLSHFILLFVGMIYPCYASFKALRSKDSTQYVNWMTYWIIFSIVRCLELITDIFLCWVPFYYEAKVIFVLWLLLPSSRGCAILYWKYLHPILVRKEEEIDELLKQIHERGYAILMELGTKFFKWVLKTIQQIWKMTGKSAKPKLIALPKDAESLTTTESLGDNAPSANDIVGVDILATDLDGGIDARAAVDAISALGKRDTPKKKKRSKKRFGNSKGVTAMNSPHPALTNVNTHSRHQFGEPKINSDEVD